jgi:hypothetical protein
LKCPELGHATQASELSYNLGLYPYPTLSRRYKKGYL